ncbi:Hypothetical predicted protein [Olea europaea subsp. europaea]|uniref:Uncharacterized protein n=1 Tax=Olea europaea subsp. europaea TaxID=158383 RepID=A0A8S0UW06_OLEEU|nr:Hypothetical predicted protein [Olea europaea subsp. europaea]
MIMRKLFPNNVKKMDHIKDIFGKHQDKYDHEVFASCRDINGLEQIGANVPCMIARTSITNVVSNAIGGIRNGGFPTGVQSKIQMATEYKLLPDIKPGDSNWTIKAIVSEKCSPTKARNSQLKYQHIWLMDPKVTFLT